MDAPLDSSCEPFLKWAGGKRWLAPAIAQAFSLRGARYVEPFLGSAAAFFAIAPDRALLADINEDLIRAYMVVRTHPRQLISSLLKLRPRKSVFLKVRSRKHACEIARAARLIFLNRTAFNGLYRVNRDGQFNVPFGCKPGTRVCEPEKIVACSAVLRNASLRTADFRVILSSATPHDNVYIDPPYTVSHENNGFRRYNEKLFSWRDQLALADMACDLAKRGCRLLVSNALHEDVLKLYPRSVFDRVVVCRRSCIAGDIRYRRPYSELLIISHSLLAGVRPQTLMPALKVEPMKGI